MRHRFVFDTGALIAAERRKERALRFLRLVRVSAADVIVPLPVVAEWWRGRTDERELIMGALRIDDSLEVHKAAGVALAKVRGADASLTIDAIVMATAALRDAVLITQDPHDFARLAGHFPGVTVLAI